MLSPMTATEAGAAAVFDRRQRWAAFSVQAHKDLVGLASDLLLYERLVLPVPADERELERWAEQDWNPEVLALRKVQGAGRIFTVPWTRELRDEHQQIMALQCLAGEIGYGMTAGLLAYSDRAWPEIVAGLDPDQVPAHRPFLIAAFQSEEEAQARLYLRAHAPSELLPGERKADVALALQVESILDEPVHAYPEEAFLRAVKLTDDCDFDRARRALFNYIDGLVIDDVSETEVKRTLAALEGDYNEAVRQFDKNTRKHRAVTLIPRGVGSAAGFAGVPFSGVAGGAVSWVAGRFVPAPEGLTHPGKALALIRAAFRAPALAA